MTYRVGPRYGAIVEATADLDNAIRVVKTFDDPQDAIRQMAPACQDGERWAVVDLTVMRVVAKGSRHAGQQTRDSSWLFRATSSSALQTARTVSRAIDVRTYVKRRLV